MLVGRLRRGCRGGRRERATRLLHVGQAFLLAYVVAFTQPRGAGILPA